MGALHGSYLAIYLLLGGVVQRWWAAANWFDTRPACWALHGERRHRPVECPPGLNIAWVEGHSPPASLVAGSLVDVRMNIKVSIEALQDLENRGLLATNKSPSRTAVEQWALCMGAGAQRSCGIPESKKVDSDQQEDLGDLLQRAAATRPPHFLVP
uniref:Uncharacterized protein n=1 Tax=Alexandrium andersonii TaxID=327968 RepID=A0A7S2I9M1_9DINO